MQDFDPIRHETLPGGKILPCCNIWVLVWDAHLEIEGSVPNCKSSPTSAEQTYTVRTDDRVAFQGLGLHLKYQNTPVWSGGNWHIPECSVILNRHPHSAWRGLGSAHSIGFEADCMGLVVQQLPITAQYTCAMRIPHLCPYVVSLPVHVCILSCVWALSLAPKAVMDN